MAAEDLNKLMSFGEIYSHQNTRSFHSTHSRVYSIQLVHYIYVDLIKHLSFAILDWSTNYTDGHPSKNILRKRIFSNEKQKYEWKETFWTMPFRFLAQTVYSQLNKSTQFAECFKSIEKSLLFPPIYIFFFKFDQFNFK